MAPGRRIWEQGWYQDAEIGSMVGTRWENLELCAPGGRIKLYRMYWIWIIASFRFGLRGLLLRAAERETVLRMRILGEIARSVNLTTGFGWFRVVWRTATRASLWRHFQFIVLARSQKMDRGSVNPSNSEFFTDFRWVQYIIIIYTVYISVMRFLCFWGSKITR